MCPSRAERDAEPAGREGDLLAAVETAGGTGTETEPEGGTGSEGGTGTGAGAGGARVTAAGAPRLRRQDQSRTGLASVHHLTPGLTRRRLDAAVSAGVT